MSHFNFSIFLLCYSRFSPLAIEITCVILSIIGGLITYFGKDKIPFYIDVNIYKIFYLINIIYFIIIFIFNIIFIIFRFLDLMNNELYLLGYGLSIVEIYISLFGVITNLVDDSFIITNMKYYQEIVTRKNYSKYKQITPQEWLYTKIILFCIFFIWVNMLLMTITDNLLINIKIRGSYHTYELALEEEKKIIESQNKKDETDDSSDKKEETDVKVDNKINKANKNKKDINKENNNINNYINNNINIKIQVNDNIKKRDLISSINALLSENNLKDNLKKNEENKN